MRIIYTAESGNLAIVTAAERAQLERALGRELSEEEYRSFVLEKSVPATARDVQVVADDWTPPDTDRAFRDAWALGKDGQAFVDMARARAIHRDSLRAERNTKLAGLDVDALRAVEVGDAAAVKAVGARKQQLRDMPAHPAIEAAETPDDLRLLSLDALSSMA